MSRKPRARGLYSFPQMVTFTQVETEILPYRFLIVCSEALFLKFQIP